MKVNEIFYSIQGEGTFTGTPAVFVRFSVCNLRCPFCDTDFKSYTEMTEDEIVAEVHQYPCKHIVLTGGEPTLQITPSFLRKLHSNGRYVQIETNGTLDVSTDVIREIDWVTCSPKFEHCKNAEVRIRRINELKVVYTGKEQDMSVYDEIMRRTANLYLQPCDTQNEERNAVIIQEAVQYIKDNPQWKMSLQTQKILCVR